MKKLCRKSGKVKFDSHEQAMKRSAEILAKPRVHGGIIAFNAYQCPHCSKFHLTSVKKVLPQLIKP